jgi:hypothetical protein
MAKLGYTWYPKDWGNSESVFEMTLSERGLYRELIDLAMLNNNQTEVKIDVWSRKFAISIDELNKVLDKLINLNVIEITNNFLFIPSCEARLNLSRGGKTSKPTETSLNNLSKPTSKPISKPTSKQRERERERESKEDSPISDVFVPSQEYIDKYKMFLDWAKKNSPKILKLKEPLTIEQFYNIRQKYSFKELEDVLLSMENYKKFSSTYSSANLTLQSWLKRSYGEGSNNATLSQKKQGFEYPPLPSPPVDFTLGN